MGGPDPRTLYYGDCLDWMGRWDDETVDLIYLDPPFNSKANYNVLYSTRSGNDAQYRAFEDTWVWDESAQSRYDAYTGATGLRASEAIEGLGKIIGHSGMLAYLTYMAQRLERMHGLLKPTGSIYLHCDPTASHYLKVVMDAIFGAQYCRSEIIWRRTGAHNSSTRWGPIHDTILFYTKTGEYTWNQPLKPYMRGHVEDHFESDGRGGYRTAYYGNVLTGSGPRSGESGKPWRGFDPTAKNRHWAIPRKLWAASGLDRKGLSQHERLDALYEAGFIRIEEGRVWPIYEHPVKPEDGSPVGDIWSCQPYTEETVFGTDDCIDEDVSWLKPRDRERLGYPTQKPRGLLERIIKASSNEGDSVLDPFCGCGTTVEAADKLGRRWAGIDISSFAIDLIRKKRFRNRTIPAKGIPTDFASARKLAREQPFDFESWAITRLPGFAPNVKQVGDGGVDGRAKLALMPDDYESDMALAQIKGGRFHIDALRAFKGVTDTKNAALGCFVTLDPVSSPSARVETVRAGKIHIAGNPYSRMQLWSIHDYFDDRMPHLPIMKDPYSGKPMRQMELL